MKALLLLALGLAASLPAFAAEPRPEVRTLTGKLSTVRLLATSRFSSKEAPDGMRFLVLVSPASGVTGQLTLKETSDFQLEGESYQEKTQQALGKKFEPGTSLDTAEGFFAKQPAMRRLAPDDLTGASILLIAILGAPLTDGANVDLPVEVGFGRETEPFTFQTRVRPRTGPPKKQPAP